MIDSAVKIKLKNYLYLTRGHRKGCRASLHLLNTAWWQKAFLWVLLWGAPGLGCQIPPNVRRGAPRCVCSPRMAPTEIMHCRPPWMWPSGRLSSPVASTWSNTESATNHTSVTNLLTCREKTKYKFVDWAYVHCSKKTAKFTCFHSA